MENTTPLFLALVLGSIGVGYLVYGRRQGKKVWFYTGLALLVLPYLASTTLPMLVLGAGLLVLPHFLK